MIPILLAMIGGCAIQPSRLVPLLLAAGLGPGCVALQVSPSVGWLGGGGGPDAVTWGARAGGQIQLGPAILGLGGRLLGASPGEDPHGQLTLAAGLGTWSMPGTRRVELEGQLVVGGGWIPLADAQAVEPAFLLGPRLALPIRAWPLDGGWRSDKLLGIVLYVVPDLTYTAAYLPGGAGAAAWRHELAGGLALRLQLYSAVLP